MPFSPPPFMNNQTWEAAVQVTNAWRQQMNAAFHAASSQQMGSQATFRSNSALIAAAFVPVPPVHPVKRFRI